MIECPLCTDTFYSHTALSEHIFKAHGNKRYVGWGTGALIALLFLLTFDQPAQASTSLSRTAQVPPPKPYTALLFYDTNDDGRLDDNEAMAPDYPLTFVTTHADGTTLGVTALSDADGRFDALMQPCPCDWVLTANGRTYSGRTEMWSGATYQPVPIPTYVYFAPVVLGGE